MHGDLHLFLMVAPPFNTDSQTLEVCASFVVASIQTAEKE